MARLTLAEEDALEDLAIRGMDDPDGPLQSDCPQCGRPRVLHYSDGSEVCEKCDEVVTRGSVLERLKDTDDKED